MPPVNNPGEDRAWEILASMKPEEVCKAAQVSYDRASDKYQIRSFGMDFSVSVKNRTIASTAPGSEVLLQRFGYFFRLSVLWYLVSARDIACSGSPVRLQNIKGGDIFTRGSHTLPLEPLAQKYGENREAFMQKGESLGGDLEKIGDASVRLYPLPRIPVTLTLWLEDDEFPARTDILFDSTCDLHIPTDIIWSVAMMSLLVMM